MGHALLSPSSAHRWMACPGSARLEETFPDTSSTAAEEGTLAHEYAALSIQHALGEIKTREYNKKLKEIKAHELYSADMDEHIAKFTDLMMYTHNLLKETTPDAQCLTEQSFDLREYIPESFGTADVVLIADDVLYVIDLKYGTGTKVFAERNPQIMIYALGALLEYGHLFAINKVSMSIYQPRLDHTSEYCMTADELMAWAEKELHPAAELAFSGDGGLVPGTFGETYCQFCRAKIICEARANEKLKLEQHKFQPPELLSNEAIVDAWRRAEGLATWVKDLKEYVTTQALKGVAIPGFKLVEGVSRRKYKDENAAIEALRNEGYKDEEILVLNGLTALEKALGKKEFNRILEPAGLIVKPPGKPTLVEESDPRPVFAASAEAFNDGYEFAGDEETA